MNRHSEPPTRSPVTATTTDTSMKCCVDDCDIPATHTLANLDGEGAGANVLHPACTGHAMALADVAAKGHMVIRRIGKGRRGWDTA